MSFGRLREEAEREEKRPPWGENMQVRRKESPPGQDSMLQRAV